MSSKENPQDACIVALLYDRDERALRLIDEKYRSMLLSLMHHILHNEQDAQECLNDTYLDVWNTIPPARPQVLGAYLVTIARRRALDVYRRAHRKKRGGGTQLLPLQEEITTADEGMDQDSRRVGQIISDYLAQQLPGRRQIFLAYYYLHRSTDEIARAMGISRSAVQKQLASIRRDLRTRLEKEDITL